MTAEHIYQDTNVELSELKKFDMCGVDTNKSPLSLGQRNTGKTTLVLDYLKNYANITTGTVISLIDQFRLNYRKELPQALVYHDSSVETLHDFIKQQSDIGSLNSSLVFDELLVPYENPAESFSTVSQLLHNCHQLKTTQILTSTDWDNLSDSLITHFKYVFVVRRTNHCALKRIHKLFDPSFDSYEQFEGLVSKYCKNYACLVINLKKHTGSITDHVCWYKAAKLTKTACKL